MAHSPDATQHSPNASGDGDMSALHGAMQTSVDMSGGDESALLPPSRTEVLHKQDTDSNPLRTFSLFSTNTNTNTNANANAGTVVPVPILASSTKHQGSARSTGSATAAGSSGNITFSPLPLGRSFPDPQQPPPARRVHEFTPSPARSLAHVLEAAEAAEGARAHPKETGSDEEYRGSWSASSSVPTGTSAVHFEPQRGHNGWRSGSAGGGSSGAWIMGTSVPESRFSEFEVVYDDGVRKQRTFSLTTEPEVDDDE